MVKCPECGCNVPSRTDRCECGHRFDCPFTGAGCLLVVISVLAMLGTILLFRQSFPSAFQFLDGFPDRRIFGRLLIALLPPLFVAIAVLAVGANILKWLDIPLDKDERDEKISDHRSAMGQDSEADNK